MASSDGLRLAFDLMATTALAKVAAALDAAQVRWAPVKGVVLARTLYASPSERPYVDVDLLVPREDFARALAAVDAAGWPVHYRSVELGELLFLVGRVPIELHAEIGRPDLVAETVAEVLRRARADSTLFGRSVAIIDDVDHFMLLLANVVKDGFAFANPHQHEDLHRMLHRLRPRWDEIVARARHAAFSTALVAVSRWMVDRHGSAAFAELAARVPPPSRSVYLRVVRALTQRSPGTPRDRLRTLKGLGGLALAVWMPDDSAMRRRALARLARRGVARWLRHDPDQVRLDPRG
jgi:hypothetical protein